MMHFNGQRPSESVRLVSHQHPIVLLPSFLLAGLFLLLSLGAFAFLSNGLILGVLLISGPVLAVIEVLIALYRWRNTLLIVSTERVGFFYQKGLFKREFLEAPLQMVVQVSHKVEGIGQTLFGYGTVIVNTGDAESSIYIKDVPDPFDVQQEIQNSLTAE